MEGVLYWNFDEKEPDEVKSGSQSFFKLTSKDGGRNLDLSDDTDSHVMDLVIEFLSRFATPISAESSSEQRRLAHIAEFLRGPSAFERWSGWWSLRSFMCNKPFSASEAIAMYKRSFP